MTDKAIKPVDVVTSTRTWRERQGAFDFACDPLAVDTGTGGGLL